MPRMYHFIHHSLPDNLPLRGAWVVQEGVVRGEATQWIFPIPSGPPSGSPLRAGALPPRRTRPPIAIFTRLIWSDKASSLDGEEEWLTTTPFVHICGKKEIKSHRSGRGGNDSSGRHPFFQPSLWEVALFEHSF